MMASSQAANNYMSQVLSHEDSPPPIEARFFYASGGILIDDPVSPLPPPLTGTATSRQPPKPFSQYDNTALDKAWLELRKKLQQYHEEQEEKSTSEADVASRSGSKLGKEKQRGSPSASRSATPLRLQQNPRANSRLSQYDGTSDSDTGPDAMDGPSSSLGLEADSTPTVTGTPFVRAPSRKKVNTVSGEWSRVGRPMRPKPTTQDTYMWDDTTHLPEYKPIEQPKQAHDGPKDAIAVGVSRLHEVEMPDLKMKPIYWEPVNDIAPVVRGTWFYQDTMLPVETPVANMLEAGYVELQVWTETWKDELNSAVEVGALGEMKVVHMLWPEKSAPRPKAAGSVKLNSDSRPSTANRENLLQTVVDTTIADDTVETLQEQRNRAVETACDLIDISAGQVGADNKASGTSSWGYQGTIRSYAGHGVVYANEHEARILKPSLLPSSYYGRRPIANHMRKGYKLGVAVVRGFDQKRWDKLHPAKDKDTKAKQADRGTSTSASGASEAQRRKSDPALAEAERPKVTDLIFVIHGIGQKLSQRMESFHFTHAINAFRREVNVEMGAKDLKSRFRDDMGGIMVLPINWRNALSFEEGGYRDGDENPSHNEFTLESITPDTLPNVRQIVSDVMLDIPYYMSHHQPKMIAAVIREANRVYKLWCLNNPGFAQHGRVHTIAHSLGSVIAVDILSKQPSKIPPHLSDPTRVDLEAAKLDHYLFNTHNLILAGSPAGFFLLLRRAQLMPRIDSTSAAALEDPSALTDAVCGQQGQYGCIAVENVYNIMNGYDPVAYRMNAAVDASYAASLRKAWVPSAANGWFSIFGSSNSRPNKTGTSAPPLPRLPSNVELETHNFSREEIAEKRMLLLNDNAQIDFYVRYGGGPLEIQYLTMLSAHSSYWYIRDFVRFLVVETGREVGRKGTVEGMRAVKAKAAM